MKLNPDLKAQSELQAKRQKKEKNKAILFLNKKK